MLKGNSRKFFVVALICALLLIIPIQNGTISFLNSKTDSLDNELEFGKTTITVTEDFQGWDLKKVQLTADAGAEKVPVVVRAILVPYITDSTGNYVEVELSQLVEPVSNKITMGDFIFEMDSNWSSNWFYKDGFFYYKKVLQPGETTQPLLNRVYPIDSSTETQEKYKDKKIKVEVMADSIQAEGTAAYVEWAVKVNGENVSL